MKTLIYDRTSSINSAKKIEVYDDLGNLYFEFPYVGEHEKLEAMVKAKFWATELTNFQSDKRELLDVSQV
jgi:hypothetical protein